ncbi:DUF1295 domain-containing protein [Martelella sp. HB161492]|uniref:DUF1295 domain-containing protein n=1 Tax=Martelella sp. HB161492 TaxID=2720726 RepID=UPI001591CA29|nr:DUF1295 domain-containing protein [Martelella sp. HB161492]
MSFALLISIFVWLIVAMTIAWAIQRMTGNSGWIDVTWSVSTGLGGLAIVLLSGPALTGRVLLALVLVALWSLRLAGHIGLRSATVSDDPRYRALIEGWGAHAGLRLWWFLQIQAVASFILILSIYGAVLNPAAFPGMLDVAGGLIAIAAIAGEGISDWQLTRFRHSQSVVGQKLVCDVGLWRYSRHPNYFFEWLYWCSWPLIALSGLMPGLHSVAAFLAPVMMYWLLNHVSGIPYLEEHMLRSRGAAFRVYQQRVNAFFPGPRRPLSAAAGDIGAAEK